MCILYALVSSQVKNRWIPYQCVLPDFFQLTQSSSPPSTQRFCASVRLRYGLSSGMPRFFADFSTSSWHSSKLFDWNGLIAPPASVFDSSGITSPKSTPMTRPNPRHVSHAPMGELNENRAGVGSE